MKYVIDLSSAAERHEVHDILARALSLPAYYGRNLDALWDCLTSDLQIPCEIHLTIGNEDGFRLALREVFESAQTWHTRRGHDVRLFIL